MEHVYPSTIQAITDLLFIPEDDGPADLCIVLGGRHYKEAMGAANKLFVEGKVALFVLTGYAGYAQNDVVVSEAELALEEAKRLNMPEAIFLLETRSRNTKENIAFAHDLITQELTYDTIKTVTFICKTFHTRRVLMTAKKVMPAHVTYRFIPVLDERDIRPSNWWLHEPARTRTLGELARITDYTTKGDLALT